MDYQSTAAYPPVEVECKNPAYARAMLSNLGGQNSEMSAVSSYFYNHLITGPMNKDVSDIFMHIAVVEMHHLDIFGELAQMMGADPRLWECRHDQYKFWSPAYIPYPKDLYAVLKSSLSGEQDAIRKYRCQMETIQDPHIVALLGRIIEDEEVHVAIYKKLLQELCLQQ